MPRRLVQTLLAFLLVLVSLVRSSAEPSPFAPLEQWRSAVLAGDPEALRSLYSGNPTVMVRANAEKTDADEDVRFWLGLKANALDLRVIRYVHRPDLAQVIFTATAFTTNGKSQTVSDDQVWQKQGEQWRIVGVTRVDDPQLQQPADMQKDLYPANANAATEIKEALEKAQKDHKRVLLVVGANWCYDCHVLDLAFHRPDIAPVLDASYEIVHVGIGDGDDNKDLLAQYQLSKNKGIPVLGVLEADGKVLVAQKNGEFENARALTAEELLAFLNRWKAK